MSYARLVLLALFLMMICGGKASEAVNCAVKPGMDLQQSKGLLLARYNRLQEDRASVQLELNRLYQRMAGLQERIDQTKGKIGTIDDSLWRCTSLLKEVEIALATSR